MSARRIDCGNVVKYICDNLDEGLNSRRCREIRKHLKNCPNCTAYLDSLKKTVLLYKRIRKPSSKERIKPVLQSLFEHIRQEARSET